MKVNLILASSLNNVIANNGQIPWELPEDMEHLRKLTDGQYVLMGKNTFDSLPAAIKPLPGRETIVLSQSFFEDIPDDAEHHEASVFYNGVHYVNDLERFLEQVQLVSVWVIGGKRLYDQLLPVADCIYMTKVFKNIKPNSPEDHSNLTYGPDFNIGEWEAEYQSRVFKHSIYEKDPDRPGKFIEVDHINFQYVKYIRT